jgi:hypothetical protein
MQHINYCSHAEQLTFNCHKGGWGGAYHGTVVYFVIFRRDLSVKGGTSETVRGVDGRTNSGMP